MVPELSGSEQRGDDRLSLIFGALAHPLRRQILARLVKGVASIAELAQPFDVTARAISKHIAVLERAGLVTRSRHAQTRPSRLDVAALRSAHAWLDDYRVLWQTRFDRIDTIIENDKNGGSRS